MWGGDGNWKGNSERRRGLKGALERKWELRGGEKMGFGNGRVEGAKRESGRG